MIGLLPLELLQAHLALWKKISGTGLLDFSSFVTRSRDTEDRFVTGAKGWKGLFTDFTVIDREMKRVAAMKNVERTPLVKLCTDNINRVNWYNQYVPPFPPIFRDSINRYSLEIHEKADEFQSEKKKWETAKSTLEQWIQKEIDDLKAEEERKKEERKRELARQKEIEKEAEHQREVLTILCSSSSIKLS